GAGHERAPARDRTDEPRSQRSALVRAHILRRDRKRTQQIRRRSTAQRSPPREAGGCSRVSASVTATVTLANEFFGYPVPVGLGTVSAPQFRPLDLPGGTRPPIVSGN